MFDAELVGYTELHFVRRLLDEVETAMELLYAKVLLGALESMELDNLVDDELELNELLADAARFEVELAIALLEVDNIAELEADETRDEEAEKTMFVLLELAEIDNAAVLLLDDVTEETAEALLGMKELEAAA